MTAVLVPYDPSWPARFQQAAADLRRLGRSSWLVEHIGSTAVPGLSAKPIIDLAVRLDDAADFEQHRPGLAAGGWRAGSAVINHPVMMREQDGMRTDIAHFCRRESWDTVSQRIFRDWLLTHPADAHRYETVKRQAAQVAMAGGASYNAAKTAVVEEIVDRARAERGLPRQTISDK